MHVFDLIAKYQDGLFAGLLVTLQLCLIVWFIGLVFGAIIGVLGARSPFWIGGASQLFSFALSGVPILILLFWLHYPAQALMGIVIPPFYTAAAALALVNVVAVADTIRPAFQSFPKQFVTAAIVCGLNSNEIYWNIQIPIILRQVIPSLLMIQVNMLQATLFASLISVDEMFRVVQRINAVEYKPVEVYSTIAVFFLLICLPLNGLALWLKQQVSRDLSER